MRAQHALLIWLSNYGFIAWTRFKFQRKLSFYSPLSTFTHALYSNLRPYLENITIEREIEVCSVEFNEAARSNLMKMLFMCNMRLRHDNISHAHAYMNLIVDSIVSLTAIYIVFLICVVMWWTCWFWLHSLQKYNDELLQ